MPFENGNRFLPCKLEIEMVLLINSLTWLLNTSFTDGPLRKRRRIDTEAEQSTECLLPALSGEQVDACKLSQCLLLDRHTTVVRWWSYLSAV